MKARLIQESINFEKSQDPKISLNIGKSTKAKEILDKLYKEREYNFLTYKINSLDDIKIYFKDSYRDKIRGDKNAEPLFIWTVKFIEILPYELTSEEHKGYHSLDSNIYKEWVISKKSIYNDRWPNDYKIISTPEIEISKKIENSEEKAKIILKAFNEQFEPAYGFELIDTIKIPIDKI